MQLDQDLAEAVQECDRCEQGAAKIYAYQVQAVREIAQEIVEIRKALVLLYKHMAGEPH